VPPAGPVEPGVVLVDGPWRHRDVSANGTRLHVAEAGTGPLVLLLHGFPEFWWSWRRQLPALAAAGFRAVAPDLRGYGASDKPPRGYDAFTLAADVAGLIRALGERDAVVAGTDWGGFLGWSTAALHPQVVRRLVVLGMPHPLRQRAAMVTDRQQRAAGRPVWDFQLPRRPERRLTAAQAGYVGRLLHAWGGPGFPDEETELRVREAIRIPGVAHSALEYFRWAVRSVPRPDGRRFARTLSVPIAAPTLQLHGDLDPYLLARTAMGSGRYVAGRYEWRLFAGCGHFLPEEAPAEVTEQLLRWAGS
jgi:pimeloyl-ACP methyl ester carboxylesterase